MADAEELVPVRVRVVEARPEVGELRQDAAHVVARADLVAAAPEHLIEPPVELIAFAVVHDGVVDRADVGDAVRRTDRAHARRRASEIEQAGRRVDGRTVFVEQVRRVGVRPRPHHEVAELFRLDRELLACSRVLAHAFVGEEVERVVAADGTAEAPAEVVLVEVRLRRVVQRLEVGLRPHVVVPVEREPAAADHVRPAARHEADRRAGVAAEVGRRIVRDDLEFLDGFRVGHDQDRARPGAAVDAESVDHGVVRAAALAAGVEPHSLFLREEVGAAGQSQDAWLQRRERQRVAAGNRQIHDALALDDRGEIRFLRLDVGRDAAHLNRFGHGGRHRHVEADGGAD